jgi:hypothetical protein
MKWQISVVGSGDGTKVSESMKRHAEEVGFRISQKGGIVVTGGMGGVMSAAARGAKRGGGLVMAVIPFPTSWARPQEIDVLVESGLGWGVSHALQVRCSHAIISIGGGSGTLAELSNAYMHDVPIVALHGHGGITDLFAGKYLDSRRFRIVVRCSTPRQAVETAFKLAREHWSKASGMALKPPRSERKCLPKYCRTFQR